jgi:hypothetical protein
MRTRALTLLILTVPALCAWAALPAQAESGVEDVRQAITTVDVPVRGRLERRALDPACLRCPPSSEWIVTLPIWVPGVTGTMAVGGTTITSPESNSFLEGIDRGPDVATALEFAFVGAVSHRRGRWTGAIDAFGVRMGNEIKFQLGGVDVESEFSAAIARARVGYSLGRHRVGGSAVAEHAVYAGVRFHAVEVDIEPTATTRVQGDRTWWDPLIGVRSHIQLNDRWSILLQGDVGGFGVGSDLAWSLLAGVEYRISRRFGVTAAWSILDIDYARTLLGVPFLFDVHLSGPHLALSFYF